MKRMIFAGVLIVATGAFGLMAQPQGQPAKPPAAQQGPTPKSQAEQQAVMAMMQAQGNPDAAIKAADELLTKFADTEYKEIALLLQAVSYQQKGDLVKATIYGERVLEINPKNIQITLMLGEVLAQSTRENDLDKDEKLTRAEKLLIGTIETLKTTAKPNPQLSDSDWEDNKSFMTARAHNATGMIALVRKKYDVAIKEFQAAVADDPQDPTYSVRLASVLHQTGKDAEAVAIIDKVLADPQLHPQIKSVAMSIKTAATPKK